MQEWNVVLVPHPIGVHLPTLLLQTWMGLPTTFKIIWNMENMLLSTLITIAKIASPIAPFYMDKMYRDLNAVTGKENYESVHLAYFPKVNEQIIDKSLEERMEMAQTISSMILGLRRKVSIKVRQPLQKIMVPSVSDDFAEQMAKVEQIIKTETNIKEIQILDDSSDFLVKKIKANFKVLGPRYGKIMKQVANAISQMSQKDITSLERNDSFTLNVEGQEVAITKRIPFTKV